MQTIRYSPEEEQKLMATLWSPQLADDPEAFVLFVYPWGVPGTPLAKFKGPRKWQREVLRGIAKHIKDNKWKEGTEIDMTSLRDATASGRGIGKSALVSWLSHWMSSTRVGSSTRISANSENQLRSITWSEMSKWLAMSINSHWFSIAATKITPEKWLADLVERDLKKGTRYWSVEGVLWSEENPDAFAGPHNQDGMMVIFDESSGIPNSIWEVAAGFFTENILDRYWMAFSNPRRNTGYFFECFNAKRDFWQTRNIDARTVEDTDKNVYAQIIAEYGEDSYQAKVEVYGEFPGEGDDQFINATIVEAAMQRKQYRDVDEGIVIGIDPARGGNDSTVICVRQGRDIIWMKKYRGEDTMAIVGKVRDVMDKFDPDVTVIDEGGLGYGILDRLNEAGYPVFGVNFGWKPNNGVMYYNKRAEMWGDMKQWLRDASIPNDKTLKADLISPRKKDNSMGTIQLEGKKEMRARGLASPDGADAIAVTFAYPVHKREQVFEEDYEQKRRVRTNPYAC